MYLDNRTRSEEKRTKRRKLKKKGKICICKGGPKNGKKVA
jgi:hypothetical protein